MKAEIKMEKKHLKREFNKLWSGEMASIISFWFCYFMFYKYICHQHHQIQVLYPLSVLCVILLEGLIYWIICLKRIQGKQIKNCGHMLQILKIIDQILLLLYIPLYFSTTDKSSHYFIGILIWLFAIIEYINYFIWRLSYNSLTIVLKQLKKGKLKRSKIANEISNKIRRTG